MLLFLAPGGSDCKQFSGPIMGPDEFLPLLKPDDLRAGQKPRDTALSLHLFWVQTSPFNFNLISFLNK